MCEQKNKNKNHSTLLDEYVVSMSNNELIKKKKKHVEWSREIICLLLAAEHLTSYIL
jgi:hypothetical protein